MYVTRRVGYYEPPKTVWYYTYNITLDGVTSYKEFPYKLDYKKAIIKLKEAGYKEIHFEYKGAYHW